MDQAIQCGFCPDSERIPPAVTLLLRYVHQVPQDYPTDEIKRGENSKQKENEVPGIRKALREEKRAEYNRTADEIPLPCIEHMPLEGGVGNCAVEPYSGE